LVDIFRRNQDISEDSFPLAWMVLTLILIVVWDISWSEFVLVPFQGLRVLILIVALDIPGPRYEIFFSIPTFKLVVASFVKFVVIIRSVNIWFGKSLRKPPDKSRGCFFQSILFRRYQDFFTPKSCHFKASTSLLQD
jgi:hypothetical protein